MRGKLPEQWLNQRELADSIPNICSLYKHMSVKHKHCTGLSEGPSQGRELGIAGQGGMEPTQLLCAHLALQKGWKSLQEFAMSCTQDKRLNRGEQTGLGEICLFPLLWFLQQPLVPLWPDTFILSPPNPASDPGTP